MNNRHQDWIKQAIALALENVRSGRGGPFGAVVVKNEGVIASGTNQVTIANDPSAHAEIVAIRAACRALGNFRLEKCELYSSCEPCPMCLGAIYWARLARYYYACTRVEAAQAGFDDVLIRNELKLAPEQRLIPGQAVSQEHRMAPFLEWNQSANKILY